jgi:hypothetical protein
MEENRANDKGESFDPGLLLLNTSLHNALLAISFELLLHCYGLPELGFEGPLLRGLEVGPYEVWRCIESVLRADASLPPTLARRLARVEERLLEAGVWEAGSPLLAALEAHHRGKSDATGSSGSTAQAQSLSIAVEVCLRKVARLAASRLEFLLHGLALLSPQVLGKRHHLGLGLGLAFARSPAQASPWRERTAVFAGAGPASSASVSPRLAAQVWTAVRHVLAGPAAVTLLAGRHLDQLLLCALYGVCKLEGGEGVRFAHLIDVYRRLQPEETVNRVLNNIVLRAPATPATDTDTNAAVYDSSRRTPTSSPAAALTANTPIVKHAQNQSVSASVRACFSDIIALYNHEFLPIMRPYLLRLRNAKLPPTAAAPASERGSRMADEGILAAPNLLQEPLAYASANTSEGDGEGDGEPAMLHLLPPTRDEDEEMGTGNRRHASAGRGQFTAAAASAKGRVLQLEGGALLHLSPLPQQPFSVPASAPSSADRSTGGRGSNGYRASPVRGKGQLSRGDAERPAAVYVAGASQQSNAVALEIINRTTTAIPVAASASYREPSPPVAAESPEAILISMATNISSMHHTSSKLARLGTPIDFDQS